MGLDVYVGSLTRYLCGDWETVVQKWARETGRELQVIRQHNPPDAITEPAQVLPAVLSWRDGLSRGLQQAGGPALDWDERPNAPYFTDKPAWDAYGDLILWTAYTEEGRVPPPVSSPENWHDDPELREARGRQTRYPNLLHGAEVWIPADFDFTFNAPWVTGDTITFGSSPQLIRELRLLNSRIWKASDQQITTWRLEGKERHDSLEKGAKFALSLFLTLAVAAVANRLVMKLDY